MRAVRHAKWSAAFILLASVGLGADEQSLQQLYESGQDEAVVERAGEGRASSPEDTYLAALAYLRMERRDNAESEFRRLAERDDVWRAVGKSALATLDHNADEAVAGARQAAESAPDNLFAQFQLGRAESLANDWGAASRAFGRAAEIRPDFAYAHYNAGLAYQKNRNPGRASDYYNAFVKLAPDAPERPGVLAILRAMRK
jgi:tetratricopeptide (TPR) repeat protein